MQLYFPNFKTVQGAIGIFEYLSASALSSDANVIFDSDLNLENLTHLIGGTGPAEKYKDTDIKDVHSFISFLIENWTNSNSQLFQDLYVLWALGNKHNGVFAEVGTAYPNFHNNTWIMESRMGWSGALAEPNPMYTNAIRKTRISPLEVSAIEHRTGLDIEFVVADDFAPGGGLLENYERKVGDEHTIITDRSFVKTISICDFLVKNNIPAEFDYLSFDTTGNAADVSTIESMLIGGYKPSIISYGHNYKSHRPALTNMLNSYGYIKQFEFLSKWDDWYYHKDVKKNNDTR